MNSLVTPLRRNLKFHLPIHKVTTWNRNDVHVSQFMNTMSLFFPEGERFFIDSVRNYRDEITNPELKKAITAFIGQEAMHSREHIEYNQAMVESGFSVDKMEKQVSLLLDFLKTYAPKPFQLAITIALEHLTAIMADSLLSHDDALTDTEPHFKALWQWHAVEETEHKAVAFDVYEAVIGKGTGAYTLRASTLVLATAVFFALCYAYYVRIVNESGKTTNLRGWWNALQYQWIKPGLLRRAVPAWLDYFKPDFHPWDHDNRGVLSITDELVQRVESFAS